MFKFSRIRVRMMSTLNSRQRNPLIAIVGATGTGKSDLAVELALRFNGEIINGDAMQMYEGLPIITNKMPLHERKGIPHHLLGCIPLDKPAWTVGQFVKSALSVIDEIRARGRIPILVGGTHYYTQALLFKDHIIENDSSSEIQGTHPILQEPTDVILAKLKEVDPAMADRWHPNDRRKIQRSLEIWLNTGKPASETYVERLVGQGSNTGMSSADDCIPEHVIGEGGSLRFPTLLFWVHSSRDTLIKRLDSRVLTMVRNGLLDEVQELIAIKNVQASQGHSVDCGRGIWISIGFKEFESSETSREASELTEIDLTKLKDLAIEQTQAATRQYAKSQVRWIRIKLLNALARSKATNTTFLMDGSDIARWAETVKDPTVEITKKFLSEQLLPDPRSLSEAAKELLEVKSTDMTHRPDLWVKKTCDACGTTCATPATWEMHVKSRGHRRAVSVKPRRAYGPTGEKEEKG